MLKIHFPVKLRSNVKAQVTEALFKEWFHICFVPEVKGCCKEKNTPFKILLPVDNAPGPLES
jgi:hypothetical protein